MKKLFILSCIAIFSIFCLNASEKVPDPYYVTGDVWYYYNKIKDEGKTEYILAVAPVAVALQSLDAYDTFLEDMDNCRNYNKSHPMRRDLCIAGVLNYYTRIHLETFEVISAKVYAKMSHNFEDVPPEKQPINYLEIRTLDDCLVSKGGC